jgi:hypothetical protein
MTLYAISQADLNALLYSDGSAGGRRTDRTPDLGANWVGPIMGGFRRPRDQGKERRCDGRWDWLSESHPTLAIPGVTEAGARQR